MNESVNDRILSIVNELFNGNISSFARAVNVKQPTLNTILGERKSKPSFDIIQSIINASALNISSIWLITGEGSMLKSESSSQGAQQSSSDYTLIAELKKEISALKDENNQLKGENKILRELAGLGERKESGNKSA